MNVNPFQFALGFKDTLAKGLKKAGGFLGGLGKTAEGVTSKFDKLSFSVDNINTAIDKAGGLVTKLLAFAGVSLVIGKLTDHIQAFDKEFTQLTLLTGSTSQSQDLQNWFDDVTSHVAVNRDTLMSLTQQARKYNTTVNDLDISGLYATSKLTGQTVDNLTASLADMTQTMKLTYTEAVAKSIELTGTTQHADKILKAMNSTAFNSEERFKALAGAMANVVPPDLRLASTSLGEMSTMIGSIMTSFGRAFAGDPMKSGPIFEIRMAVGDLLKFLQDNMGKIKEVFGAIGMVIGTAIKFITRISGKMITGLTGIFGKMSSSTEGFNKNVVLPFVTFIEIIIAQIEGFISSFSDGVTEGFSGLMDNIKPYIKDIQKMMGPLLEALGFGESAPGANNFWKTTGQIIGSVLSTIIELGARLISKILPHVIEFIGKMQVTFAGAFEKIKVIWDKIINIFSNGSGKSADAFKVLEFVVDLVAGTIGIAFDILATTISTAVDVIIWVIDKVVDVIRGVQWVVMGTGKVVKLAFDAWANAGKNMWNTLKVIFEKIVGFFKKDLKGALETVTGLWNSVFGDDSEKTVDAEINKNVNVSGQGLETGISPAKVVAQASKNIKPNSGATTPIIIQTQVNMDGKKVAEGVNKVNEKAAYR